MGVLLEAGYSYDFLGIEKYEEDEDLSEDESRFWVYYNGRRQLVTYDELFDIDVDGYVMVKYWNGNDYEVDIYDSSEVYHEGEALCREVDSKGKSISSVIEYILKFEDGSVVRVYRDNISGHLSPYYFVDE